MNWTRVSKKEPCGICGKLDFCTRGEKVWGCMRVQSGMPMKNGGWLHFMDSKALSIPYKKILRIEPPAINATKRMRLIQASNQGLELIGAAQNLGVTAESLLSLGCAYSYDNHAFAFPMHDGYGNIIGIRLRNDDGHKWAVTGSRQGLFMPSWPTRQSDPVYIVEGPTDCAAALSMGLYSIGRPTCNSGNELLAVALRRLAIKRVVIVVDNDTEKSRPNGERFYPGRDGALRLSKDIGISHVLWIPPAKDIRAFYCAGGTKAMIETKINSMIWKRGMV